MSAPTHRTPTGESLSIGGLHLNWPGIAAILLAFIVLIAGIGWMAVHYGLSGRTVGPSQGESLEKKAFVAPTATPAPTEAPGFLDAVRDQVGKNKVIHLPKVAPTSPEDEFRANYVKQWYAAELEARQHLDSQKWVSSVTPTPAPDRSAIPAGPQPSGISETIKDATSGNSLAGLMGAMAGGPPGQQDGNDENHRQRTEGRQRFATGYADDGASPSRVHDAEPGTTLYQMDAIPCALDTAIYSVLPGKTSCVVTSDVYGGPDRRLLIVPKQSRITEEYEASRVSYGDKRMLLVSLTLYYPDKRKLVLSRESIAAETDGSVGMEMDVDNHWWALTRAALIGSIFGVGAQVAQGPYATVNPNTGQLVLSGFAQNMNQVGSRLAQRELMRPPTLYKERGHRFNIMLGRDIVAPPYKR